jgi:hypothetical protein
MDEEINSNQDEIEANEWVNFHITHNEPHIRSNFPEVW